jgi:phosphonatase-like hydrolase
VSPGSAACRLVVFDIGGTTIEDDGRVPSVFRAALSAHGLEVSLDEIDTLRGMSKREAVLRLVDDPASGAALAAAVYEDFRARLREEFERRPPRPIAGAAAVFERLRAAGVRIALTTGFERAIVDAILRPLGWDGRVLDAVVCAGDVAHGRPAPDLILRAMEQTGIADPRAVANVGDTTADVGAARAAGAGWNIAVLSGAHGREALEQAGATAIISSVADLASVLPVM